MNHAKIVMGSIMLLFFTAAVSQIKRPAPPPVPEAKAEKAILPPIVMKPEINYHSKPPIPPPPIPPSPPPPPTPPLPFKVK